VPEGVEFDSLDGNLVRLIFLIAAPNTEENVHLDVLSRLSVLLMQEEFVSKLLRAEDAQEFMNVIDEAEEKWLIEQEEDRHYDSVSDTAPFILAVTGCPTGIAHTYMAAEALEKKANELGYRIRIETRGSGGAKHVFSKDEIEEADAVIVASDTQIPMKRFQGKPVLICKVADGIYKPEELLLRAANGELEIYHGEGNVQSEEEHERSGAAHEIYKHLMNGVSHMLPFVVGGGILIAIAFLIDGMQVDLNHIPDTLIDQYGSAETVKNNFGSLTPLASFFKNDLGGVAFGFMLPILAGYIAMSIADRPGLAIGVLGGAITANGKSGFLGALLCGFLAGYIVKYLRKIFQNVPKAMDGLVPILFIPILGMLILGSIVVFIIEPAVGVINTALNDALRNMSGTNGVLLGALLGGMMSVDMGGPVNKAAYVFGTSQIAAGNYQIMAAVMVGGMVPPIAIALATLFYRNRFTKQERKAGLSNIIMGLSFISEGAIPYAAADPLHVIPACVIGSATAGALSVAFDCTLMAPHGGIFVFPVVGNALFYCVALLIGSIVGAVLLGFRRPREDA